MLSAVFGAWREATKTAQAEHAVLQTFREFTVNNCQCYSSDTRDQLLSIIEAGCGTLDEFNDLIVDVKIFADEDDSPTSPRSSASPTAPRSSPNAQPTITFKHGSERAEFQEFCLHFASCSDPTLLIGCLSLFQKYSALRSTSPRPTRHTPPRLS